MTAFLKKGVVELQEGERNRPPGADRVAGDVAQT
jgi:hypothetical protein